MPTCKTCSQSGWLLRVSEHGLCDDCLKRAAFEIKGKVRIIQESMELIRTSKNLEIQLSRLDLVMGHAASLLRYEQLGIHPSNPLPSELLRTLKIRRPQLIAGAAQAELNAAIMKAGLARTIAAKHNAFTKALLRIRALQATYPEQAALAELEAQATRLIHANQVQGFVDAAQKAEFKGQQKKALDQYQEALYYLQHNQVPDEVLGDQAAIIRAKVQELGGSASL